MKKIFIALTLLLIYSTAFGLTIDSDNTAKVKIDATNPHKITPKLQKGLILDMPLSEPYTEAGSDLVTSDSEFDSDSGWTVGGWSIAGGKASIDAESTANLQGGISTLSSDKKYSALIEITDYVDGDITLVVGTAPYFYKDFGITGNGIYTMEFSPLNTGTVYILQAKTDVGFNGSIERVYIKQLDATTKDRTPYGNDGTVSGATIRYDGLVNGGDGIAYIPSTTAYGTWEFDVNKGGATNDINIDFINTETDATGNGYTLWIAVDETIRMYVVTSGGENPKLFETIASYITINTNYRIKITRSLAGVFTMYIKGGSFGWDDWTTVVASTGTNPVTNNTYTTSNYFVADLDSGDKISNLKIDGKRISLANATISSGTFTTTGPSYYFDGSNNYHIDLGDSPELRFGTDDFTISGWFKTSGVNEGEVAIISKGHLGFTHQWIVRIEINGYVQFVTASTSLSASNDYYDGNWHQVNIVRDTDVGKIYIDGSIVDTDNSYFSGKDFSTTEVMAIGAQYPTSWDREFNGQISNLKIYNRALSTEEIELLYIRGKVKYQ